MKTTFHIKRFLLTLVLPLYLIAFGCIHHMLFPGGSSSTTTQNNITVNSTPTQTPTVTPTSTPTQTPVQTQATTPTSTPTQVPTQTPVQTTKPAAPSFETPTERKQYHIEISLAAQIVYIYELDEAGNKGDLAKAILCSTGKAGSETPVRKWVILDNGMEKEAVRDAWGISRYKFEYLSGSAYGQYMSRMWMVHTDENGEEYFGPSNYLLHSAPYYGIDKNRLMTGEWNKLGYPASAGCIRMNVADAKWIYDYVAAYSYVYTIQGTPDPALWAALKLPDLPWNVTKDPTDVF